MLCTWGAYQCNCNKCKDTYYLKGTTGPTCVLQYNLLTETCQVNNADGPNNLTTNQCLWCQSGKYPIDFQDYGLCVNKSYIEIVKNTEYDANCSRYILDVATLKCAECKAPNVLNEGGNCAAACSTPGTNVPIFLKIDQTPTFVDIATALAGNVKISRF